MNKLLSRQIKNIFGGFEKFPKELSAFVQTISDTYEGFDEDRELTLRSLELSSQELLEANRKIRLEADRQKLILVALRNATEILQPASSSKEWLTSKDEVVDLAKSLKKLIEEQKNHERDIESSKKITEQEKAKVEAILQSIGDGVFAVDLGGKIMLMNSVAEQLSGSSFSLAQGKYYGDIFHFIKEKMPNDPYPMFVENVIQNGVDKKLENHTILVNKNQTQISISDSASPIKDSDGKIIGCIVVIRDASREREIERVKDEFILTAAHQLRTPLGSMRWTLEMLLNYPDIPQKAREKIEIVTRSNERMTTLVNDFLSVAKIDQGKIQNEPQLSNVCEMIEESVSEIADEAKKKKIMIRVDLDKNIPEIKIDPKRFHGVIENLLSNAVKYNLAGGKAKISAKYKGGGIQIKVADNGIGIPESDQKYVYSKFYRAENAKKSDTTGSGLGLFVVKSYVEEWGGKVRFQSIEGKGSTFYVELPVS